MEVLEWSSRNVIHPILEMGCSILMYIIEVIIGFDATPHFTFLERNSTMPEPFMSTDIQLPG